ncbi:hypothetical protein Q4Q39_10065 [Flavivirga amylovorans]|uniref:Secreted protein n=1 Tax=Flavivirga amylovorans TaxID=870486 RepID=A0ABT8X206_9FLAO|nr:hypothetical protein [Flavivirga amylovorans]MDO5987743.1 hypothetical protein [Flavivirga amylovorans]
MRLYFSFFVLLVFSLSTYGQVDAKRKSIAIPAIKSKDSVDANPLLPSRPINNNTSINNINTPKVSKNLNMPKKEFSMFPAEEFGNPGELYEDRLNKSLDHLKLSEAELELKNGSTTDQYFGDFRSKAKFVNVVYRDHGYVDGDVIQVLVNDDVIHARVYLTNGFKGFKLDLQPGFNKIDFLALNQGESGPNTAEFRVVDDLDNLISSNRWNLATGVKATIIIVKE